MALSKVVTAVAIHLLVPFVGAIAWSGMASIGVFGLVFVAPFATAALALGLRPRRALSRFHQSAFATSAAYSGLMLAIVLSWFGVQILAR